MERSANAIFHEVQYFRSHPLSFLLLPAGVLLVALFTYAMITQLILGRPFGDGDMSDGYLAAFGSLYVLLGGFLIYLFFAGRLITEVRPDGIFVRFVPFHRNLKRFGFEDIASYEVTTYRPIRDYGGWGLRYGPRGRAYNVHGNRGVLLEFHNGKRLLIGSQQSDSFGAAVGSIKR